MFLYRWKQFFVMTRRARVKKCRVDDFMRIPLKVFRSASNMFAVIQMFLNFSFKLKDFPQITSAWEQVPVVGCLGHGVRWRKYEELVAKATLRASPQTTTKREAFALKHILSDSNIHVSWEWKYIHVRSTYIHKPYLHWFFRWNISRVFCKYPRWIRLYMYKPSCRCLRSRSQIINFKVL